MRRREPPASPDRSARQLPILTLPGRPAIVGSVTEEYIRVSDATNKLELAQKHLEKVQVAWDDPTDWADLSLYGFYALEAAVDAARIHCGIDATKSHASRAESA